jgi:hypothetical protein
MEIFSNSPIFLLTIKPFHLFFIRQTINLNSTTKYKLTIIIDLV